MTLSGETGGGLRELSPKARAGLSLLDRVAAELATRPAQTGDVVVRAHPLILLVRRQAFVVVIAPANVWDSERELFAPWKEKLAGFEAREADRFFGVPKVEGLGEMRLHLRPPAEVRRAFLDRHAALCNALAAQ